MKVIEEIILSSFKIITMETTQPKDDKKPHPFTILSKGACSKNLCWKLSCTTCWCMEIMDMMTKLCWDKFKRLDRNHNHNNIIQQKRLIEKVKDLSIKELVEESCFPDCLGHLGLVLSATEDAEREERILTKVWIPQFLELSKHESTWLKSILKIEDRYLRYDDLNELEFNIKSEINLKHQSF